MKKQLALFSLAVFIASCSTNLGRHNSEPKPKTPIISNVKYPAEAVKKKLEGEVIVAALIDETGKIAEIKVESSTEQIFNDAAMTAVRQTEFEPATWEGKPIKKWFTVPIRFKRPEKVERSN
jgi:TonB family protein